MVRMAAVVGAAVLAAFALVAAVFAAEPPDEEATNGTPSTRSGTAGASPTEETSRRPSPGPGRDCCPTCAASTPGTSGST